MFDQPYGGTGMADGGGHAPDHRARQDNACEAVHLSPYLAPRRDDAVTYFRAIGERAPNFNGGANP